MTGQLLTSMLTYQCKVNFVTIIPFLKMQTCMVFIITTNDVPFEFDIREQIARNHFILLKLNDIYFVLPIHREFQFSWQYITVDEGLGDGCGQSGECIHELMNLHNVQT